jgi:hypothetical protein
VAAKKIQEMGPKYVVIKKGEHGALLFHEDNVFYAPALPLEKCLIPQELETLLQEDLLAILAQTNNDSHLKI